MNTNLIFVGVGGQGVVLASNILSQACLNAGYDVKKAEVHGMSQRGGSVSSHLRFGETVHSPLIPLGEADWVVSFEWMECLRYFEYLRPGAQILTSTQRIVPVSVTFGMADYPESVEQRVESRGMHLLSVPALDIAQDLGNPKVVSTVMLGALANHLDMKDEQWLEAIAQSVPAKVLELNQKAFFAGKACREAVAR